MPINAHLPLPRRALFRLRGILLIVMLAILLLPLGGLYFFRIYENQLVQQTEAELIAQSAVLAASIRQFIRQHPDGKDYGYIQFAPTLTTPPGFPDGKLEGEAAQAVAYTPVLPQLDLIAPIQPPRPSAYPAFKGVDALAKELGEYFSTIIQDTKQVTLAGFRLLDNNGTVIAGQEEVGLSLAHVPEVQQALRGQYASVIRTRESQSPPPTLSSISRGTRIRVFTAFPVVEKGRLQAVVYLSRTPKSITKYMYDERGKLFLAAALLGTLAVLLVLFVSSTISRPIRELVKQTELVRQGTQQVIEPLPHPITREVAQLSTSFAAMSRALAERSDYIRRFATHVSHEFKTPLTAMQGALELLQEHTDSMSAAQRAQFLENLLEDTQRLRQLVNRLLELARADSLKPDNQTCTLPEVLRRLRNRYQERGLLLEYPELPDTPLLAIAADALETVLINLFDNSLQHGATATRLSATLHSTHMELHVHDNGEGISPANRDKIFTPFFTTKRNQGGTGLGLEIITSVLKAYGGNIRLGEATQGAAFIVQLPLVGSSKRRRQDGTVS